MNSDIIQYTFLLYNRSYLGYGSDLLSTSWMVSTSIKLWNM